MFSAMENAPPGWFQPRCRAGHQGTLASIVVDSKCTTASSAAASRPVGECIAGTVYHASHTSLGSTFASSSIDATDCIRRFVAPRKVEHTAVAVGHIVVVAARTAQQVGEAEASSPSAGHPG